MSFECCHNCLFRQPGCHGACKDYLEEKAEYEAKKHIFKKKNPTDYLEYISAKFNRKKSNGYKTRHKK